MASGSKVKQGRLFDVSARGHVVMRAGARRTDPSTSHDAALDVEVNGHADTHRDLCLAAVRRRPGQTGAEIAVAACLERHEASRRLPELRGVGLVRNGDSRVCVVCGTRQMTWWPTTEGDLR